MNTLSSAPSIGKKTGESLPEQQARSVEFSIACYDREVPPFAGVEIERLHGHLYCLPSYLAMTGQLDGASTYVASKDGVPATVLLFRMEGHAVTVISEFVQLDEEEIRRFAAYMFGTFSSVRRISFNRVRTVLRSLPYPWHAVNHTEDMIVELPATPQEYDARIGKNMRRNIKRYTSALQRDFPTYAYRICDAEDIGEQDIRDIIRLGCVRMESKNIEPRYTEEETRWIVQLAKRCGLIGLATIDGKVCAGAIGFRIGENYFMHVIAHDPQYNDYSLGILCYYHTICEGIARGGKRFHLLQGRYGYKYRLLAERHDIQHLDIYRNPVHAIAQGKRIVRKALDGRVLAIKQWLLHDAERSDAPGARFIAQVVNRLRQRKRSSGDAVRPPQESTTTHPSGKKSSG
ncbi:GNAT family N-acetyltransferase [Noviherbaspirillum sp.]|uniref:GNAT family N-acetyltransferase n=1 Tax=Noviherbaspirillum sp. TaxID=1926288 RepID=UPI002B488F53|nr:GNAT family N-acetyltransferase [Noviherbaspirillum sp.]HJV83035.1 GNAT family N-acetyltransferase [Noviherbaspirillum sp.]